MADRAQELMQLIMTKTAEVEEMGRRCEEMVDKDPKKAAELMELWRKGLLELLELGHEAELLGRSRMDRPIARGG